MNTGRRFFLSSVTAVVASANLTFAMPQHRGRVPQMADGSATDPNASPDSIMPVAPPPDPTARLKESQKNLRRDADHLLDLATKLKEEADNTEQTNVLSLSLVKKAEEVEKLAHQIKELVRTA